MTKIRRSVSEYTQEHDLAKKLTAAVNACYMQQAENPEAHLARHFKRLGFRDVIEGLRVREAFTTAMRRGWRVSLVINGREEGVREIEAPDAPDTAGATALITRLQGTLRGTDVRDQDSIDDLLRDPASLSTAAPNILNALQGLFVAVSHAALDAHCLAIDRGAHFVFAKICSSHARAIDVMRSRLHASSYVDNDFSRLALPLPLLWLVEGRNPRVAGITLGIYVDPPKGGSLQAAGERACLLLKLHAAVGEAKSLLAMPSGVLAAPDDADSLESLAELIRSPLRQLASSDTPVAKAPEGESVFSLSAAQLLDSVIRTAGGTLRLAVKGIAATYRAAEGRYFLEDMEKGRAPAEVAGLLEAQCGSDPIPLGYVESCFSDGDVPGQAVAMNFLYGNRGVAVCRDSHGEDHMHGVAEGKGCSVFALRPEGHTVSSLARQVCLSTPRCVAVADSAALAFGAGSRFFTANPLPAAQWNDYVSTATLLASSGALLPTAHHPVSLPLPECDTPAPTSPPPPVGRKQSIKKKK